MVSLPNGINRTLVTNITDCLWLGVYSCTRFFIAGAVVVSLQPRAPSAVARMTAQTSMTRLEKHLLACEQCSAENGGYCDAFVALFASLFGNNPQPTTAVTNERDGGLKPPNLPPSSGGIPHGLQVCQSRM